MNDNYLKYLKLLIDLNYVLKAHNSPLVGYDDFALRRPSIVRNKSGKIISAPVAYIKPKPPTMVLN